MNSNGIANNLTKKGNTITIRADDNDARIKHDAELLADFLYRLFKESRGC